MESLKLPMREIIKIYTRSELAIMAWRSSETAHLMEDMRTSPSRPEVPQGLGSPANLMPDHMTPDSWISQIEEKLGPVVHKLEKMDAETGQIDFRKLTGDEAMRYLNAINIDPGRMN